MTRSDRKLAGLIALFVAIVALWIGCMIASHGVGKRRRSMVARLSAVSADTTSLLAQANQVVASLGDTPNPAAVSRLNDLTGRAGAGLAVQQQLLADEHRLTVIGARLDRAVIVLPGLLVALAALTIHIGARSSRRKREGLCVNCGCDLRASPARCPECGEAVGAVAGA